MSTVGRFILVLLLAAVPARALAVPIFAERYNFKCIQCHTAVPELNAFGEAFLRAGFRLPSSIERHREFPLALRFSETYVKDLLPSQTRHFVDLPILISTANFGPDRRYSYFARYLFGSQGAPGSLYYAWVQNVNSASGFFERGGLFNLPLIASATQRLDTITAQPAYTYLVGHNSANLSTPRWGVLTGERNARVDAELAVALDEYRGAAYGAPAPPSDFVQSFAQPELFASALFAIGDNLKIGGLGLTGTRAFKSVSTGARFEDGYAREGVQARFTSGRFDLIGQQLWGRDANGDGLGHAIASSGGFVTLKYRPIRNAYVGVRYDAAANPFASRDWDAYAVWGPTIHSRLVIEHVHPIATGGAGQTTSIQFLFALPLFEPRRR